MLFRVIHGYCYESGRLLVSTLLPLLPLVFLLVQYLHSPRSFWKESAELRCEQHLGLWPGLASRFEVDQTLSPSLSPKLLMLSTQVPLFSKGGRAEPAEAQAATGT